MTFFVVPFQLLIVGIINILHAISVILLANMTPKVCGGSEVKFESIQVIKPDLAKFAIGMIQEEFAIGSLISFLEVFVEFQLGVEMLFRGEAFFAVKAYITRSKTTSYQNCLRCTSFRCFLSWLRVEKVSWQSWQ